MNKKIIFLLALMLTVLLYTNVFGFDGDIYMGKYINSTLRSKPGGMYTNYSEYIGGVEVGHKLFNNKFRPYLKFETMLDEYNESTFHPASIKYEIGGKIEIYKGIYVDVSHLCWHPIDSAGIVEQYNLIKVGIKF